MERRTFLKITGATAVMAPGAALVRPLPARTAVTGPETVLLGGAPVRPPSVPLTVRSPYLSKWLPATDLTATTPQFWFGSTRGFAGMVRIDEHVY